MFQENLKFYQSLIMALSSLPSINLCECVTQKPRCLTGQTLQPLNTDDTYRASLVNYLVSLY